MVVITMTDKSDSKSGDDKSQDSRTQIVLAVVGLVGTVSVALFANWKNIFPPSSSPQTSSSSSTVNEEVEPAWETMGYASTGEKVSVDSNSIRTVKEGIAFRNCL
jgi:cytoskeletal protein RodZ